MNANAWADGAAAERFMAVPGDAKVGFDPARGWDFPDGTTLVQTLSLEREVGNAASRFRVETRILLRQQGDWAGYTSRWKSDQSDATLVGKGGADTSFGLHATTGLALSQPQRVHGLS